MLRCRCVYRRRAREESAAEITGYRAVKKKSTDSSDAADAADDCALRTAPEGRLALCTSSQASSQNVRCRSHSSMMRRVFLI